jgi:hypothetical protein
VLPLVSVICVSNRWSFIRPMLQLFHAQTWANKELILVDSSAGGKGIDIALSSGEWMLRSPLTDESAPQYPTLFKYDQVQEGALVPLMRNHGMSLATGEYMTWMDDDGWHDPSRIERLMLKMDESEVDAIGVQGIYWTHALNGDGIYHYRGTRGMPLSGSMVWHRRCYEYHKFDPAHSRASDSFWIKDIRRDKRLRHGTINVPELCVGISHGKNISNPTVPTLCRQTGLDYDKFHGSEFYGLWAHCLRIRQAVKELDCV